MWSQKYLRTVDLGAAACGSRACERCELRIAAFHGVCDRRNVKLTTSNILREVRRLRTFALTAQVIVDKDLLARQTLRPLGLVCGPSGLSMLFGKSVAVAA